MKSQLLRVSRLFFLLPLFAVVFFSGSHTAFAVGEPVVVNVFPQSIMPTSAIPTGEVTDEGVAAVIGIWVEYGADTNYGSEIQRYNLNELTLPGTFDVPITGLTCNTTYHYRFKIRNNGMLDGYSTDDTFTTSECYPDDIVSHWTLNEGDPSLRYDSVGDNDLTSHGSPSTLTAHHNDGLGASTGQYLNIADNTSLSTGNNTNFTVSMWVKLLAKGGTQVFVSKFDDVSTGEYAVYYENIGDRFMFSTYTNGTGYAVNADTLGSPQVGTWYHITATHSAENHTNIIQVDSLAADTINNVVEHQDSAGDFVIGAFGSVPSYFAFAVIDDVRFSKSAAVDTAAPTIESVSPANDETNVAVDTPIVITFSESMETSSIIISSGPCDESCPSFDEVWSEGDTVLTLNKNNGLFSTGTEYTIEIDAEDLAANTLSETYAWSFTTEYDPYVLTEIEPIPAKVRGNTATYTFSVSGEGEAQYIAEMCGGNSDGFFTSMSDDPEHQSVTLTGLEPGITYECQFAVQSLSGYSNFLTMGPFRVVNSTGGYASAEFLAKSGVVLENPPKQLSLCSADQLLTFPVDIKKLQAHLVRLGFNPGPIDGIRGPMTTAAIKQAQAKLGTLADGLVGPLTRNLINNSCTK